MAYFVAHMQKYSNNLGGLKSHNERDTKNHSNENIDVSKKSENVELIDSRDSNKSYEFEFKKLMKKKYKHKTKNGDLRKIRENQVKFNSFVFSASPEYFEKKSKEQQIKYFEDCKKYLETKFNSENIISAKIHFDETTPHMHLVAVPLTNDGRLSSKEIFNKQFLKDLQEDCPKFLKENGHKEIERGENANGLNKRISDLKYTKQKIQKEKEQIKLLENQKKTYLNLELIKKKIKSKKAKNLKNILYEGNPEFVVEENLIDEIINKAQTVDKYKDLNEKLESRIERLEIDKENLKRELQESRREQKEHKKNSKEFEKYQTILKDHPEMKKTILDEKIVLDYQSLEYSYLKEKFIKDLVTKSKTTELNKSEKYLVKKSIEQDRGWER